MKIELIDLTETRKQLVIEIPREIVHQEIDRVTREYGRAARIPGFRPGKVPAHLVRQRFRQQILHEVAHTLIPRAVDDALRERGVEPVDTPDIREVVVEEDQPLRFTAAFETVPPIDPGDYTSVTLRRPPVVVEPAQVEQALEQLRQRLARYEPVEDRAVQEGDTVVVDLERHPPGRQASAPGAGSERHEHISIDVGASANPPGFDEQILGLTVGDRKTFTVTYPGDHAVQDLAGTVVEYTVTVNAIKRRVVPELDDELARDLGDFASLAALRARVEEDLRRDGEREADRQMRDELLKHLAARVTFDAPEALLAREIDRRVEEFARRLIEQQIDPSRVKIDWEEFRQRQRNPAAETVQSALVLDEVARREGLVVTEAEVEREVGLYAERAGRTPAAVRAQLEQEGRLERVRTGLRRQKAIDFVLTRAKIVHA